MFEKPEAIIRKFTEADREDVRRISRETAFLGLPSGIFFEDDEVLSDALTLYFTDYEPGSCFVAVEQGKVMGYLIGTKDAKVAEKITSQKINLRLFRKALERGLFFKKNTLRFFIHVLMSLLKGEFNNPDFSKQYPAMLHINIDKDFRGRSVGRRLIEAYLSFLKNEGIGGVHFGTVSEEAKNFFLKLGFETLFKGRRTYLRYYSGKDLPYYIFGKKI